MVVGGRGFIYGFGVGWVCFDLRVCEFLYILIDLIHFE